MKRKPNYALVLCLVVFSFTSMFYKIAYLPSSVGTVDLFEFIFMILPVMAALLYLSICFLLEVRKLNQRSKDGS